MNDKKALLSSAVRVHSWRLKRMALLVFLCCACNSTHEPRAPTDPREPPVIPPESEPPVVGRLITVPLTVKFIKIAEGQYRCEYMEVGRVYEGVGFVPTIPPVPYIVGEPW